MSRFTSFLRGSGKSAASSLILAVAGGSSHYLKEKRETECGSHISDHVQDVVVIGGGIIGTSLCAYLSCSPCKMGSPELQCGAAYARDAGAESRQLKVTLLEKQSIASEATGLSAGTIYSVGLPKQNLAPDDPLGAKMAISHISNQLYEHLQKSTSDIGYSRCGCVKLASNDEEKEEAEKLSRIHSASALDSSGCQYLDSPDKIKKVVLPDIDPSNVTAGIYAPESGQVNAGLAAHALAEMAEEVS